MVIGVRFVVRLSLVVFCSVCISVVDAVVSFDLLMFSCEEAHETEKATSAVSAKRKSRSFVLFIVSQTEQGSVLWA